MVRLVFADRGQVKTKRVRNLEDLAKAAHKTCSSELDQTPLKGCEVSVRDFSIEVFWVLVGEL